jgi:hypothetical protein
MLAYPLQFITLSGLASFGRYHDSAILSDLFVVRQIRIEKEDVNLGFLGCQFFRSGYTRRKVGQVEF